MPTEYLLTTENNTAAAGRASKLPAAKISHKRIAETLDLRRQQLEKIKPHIPLKTYDLVLARMEKQQSDLRQILAAEEQMLAQDPIPQILNKVFFEQRFLKPQKIRIE